MYHPLFASHSCLDERQEDITVSTTVSSHKKPVYSEGTCNTPAPGMRGEVSHLGLGNLIVQRLPPLFEPFLKAMHAALPELANFIIQSLLFLFEPFLEVIFGTFHVEKRLLVSIQIASRLLQELALMLKLHSDVIHERFYGTQISIDWTTEAGDCWVQCRDNDYL